MFVKYFGMPIAKSAPHIYLSALPFAPTSSLISSCYSSQISNLPLVKHGQLSHWPTLQMMIPAENWITSVAFSPNGQHIVSGSENNTVCVWDTTTGETVAGPFAGHT